MMTEYSNIINQIKFNNDGLVPVIAQQYDTNEVLMMAWMNKQAVVESLNNGRVCYWSRSRQNYWRKGESSGQVQLLKELIIDCDGDTLLAKVEQKGVACHTGRRTCFYKTIKNDEIIENCKVEISPDELYK
jgi:phosphoribosyl-AMP cyclohydrolase